MTAVEFDNGKNLHYICDRYHKNEKKKNQRLRH